MKNLYLLFTFFLLWQNTTQAQYAGGNGRGDVQLRVAGLNFPIVGYTGGNGRGDATFRQTGINLNGVLGPTISSFTPASGCAGSGTVTITGTSFNGATAVSIGGTPVSTFTVNSATQITANIGSGTTGTIQVTNPAGTATSSGTFTVFSINPSATAGSIACNGGSTSVTISATGGSGTYIGTGVFTANAGSKVYTISDAIGCSATTSISITQPPPLTASISATAIACNGGSTFVYVSATGGTTAYSGTGTFTKGAGTATYTVTDANGCSAATSISITQPTALTISVSSSSIVCNGGTAILTVSGSGGTPAYSGTGFYTASAGTYTFTITDQNGCSASTSTTLTQPLDGITSFAPISACPGSLITILGNNLNSVTSLFINGILADFTIISASELQATVPPDASSGFIAFLTSAGCWSVSASTLTVNSCSSELIVNIKAFLQGYYIGLGQMQPVLLNQNVPGSSDTETDTVMIELSDPTSAEPVASAKTILMTDGTASANLIASEGSYHIGIRHRSSVFTVSAEPVPLTTGTNPTYDFSSAANQAFADNMVELEPGVWGFYMGDLNQDEYIDASDYPAFDEDNLNGLCCSYFNTDMNGDGYVDASDYPVFDFNNLNGVASIHP